jgi:hypothetical protein
LESHCNLRWIFTPLFLASRKQTSIGCRLASLHLKLFSMLRCKIVDRNNYRKMIQL